ncbi:MAG: hypothetical protein IPM82_11820 [Saprospiraceae bacterium]|nr:hypothetical protein [Saprospiraceae bacterium]
MEPQQFEVNLTCANVETTSTWDAVFGIRKRYNAKICQKMKEWLQDLLKQYRRRQGRGESLEQFLDDKLEDFRDMPLLDKNFLRNAIFSRLREDGILVESMQEMLANN